MKQFLLNKGINLTLVLLCTGLLLGIGLIFYPGTIFMGAFTFITVLAIWKILPLEDKPFLFKLFVVGMLFRVVLYFICSFFSFLQGNDGWIIGDSWGNRNFAWLMAQYIREASVLIGESTYGHAHELTDYTPFTHPYGIHGYTKFLAVIFSEFGPIKISARIFSCLAGVISGLFIYYIVKGISGKKEAKLVAILTIFFPTLVLWSITFLKDAPYIFTSCITVWSFLRFRKTKKISYFFTFAITLLVQHSLRREISIFFIAAAFLIAYFFVSKISLKMKFIIIIIAIIFVVHLSSQMNFEDFVSNRMARIALYNRGVVNTEGSTYRIFEDKHYDSHAVLGDNITWIEFSKVLAKGWFYILLVPFPWKITSALQLLAYPQIILWYFLLPFIFIGFLSALRYKWRETFIIGVYLFTITSIIALGSGNIGTALRHRDMLTPFFLIFGSLGLVKTFTQLNNFKR